MPDLIKRILVVVESIDVDDSSGSKANVALIKNLYKAGFELQVYHYTRKDIQLGDIPCHSIKENRRSLLFFLSRSERYLRYWFNLNLYKPIEQVFGFSFTLFNDRNSIVAALNKINDFEPDLVLTLSKGTSFRPHHSLLKIPKWHSKWMAYIHDPYPFASYPRPYDYVEPGHQKKREFFLNVSEKARFAAYPSKLLAEWMESYFPPLKGKSVIIPHQIDEEEVDSPELPEYFKKDAFTIVHAGALMNARNPRGLIKAFREFLKEVPEAAENSQLLFIGKKSKYTPEFEELKREVSQFYSSDDYLPFTQVQAIQKNAAVNVILEAKGPISPFLPGKFPHCIQAGKPILLLGPYYSESRRLLGDDYPWWSEIDDEEKITQQISELYFKWLDNQIFMEYDYSFLRERLSALSLNQLYELIN
ncbi:glycosyltransferase family protein [Salegentibacter sediminis]|uniref:UDP-glycosyltransferase n=1 Tax=Salegentibacter sediminis TaxID=1930251 RepID=UPI000DA21F68|nr:UDP-glycosyltransferase [Salegentibacter sediminis]